MSFIGHLTHDEAIAYRLYPNKQMWIKIGYSPTINTTLSDIWSHAGVFAFLSAQSQLEIITDDATDADLATLLHNATCDAGGTGTTLIDASEDFVASGVAVGDTVVLDKSGTQPAWGYVTSIAQHTLTLAKGFTYAQTTVLAKPYVVIDRSAKTGIHAVYIEYLDANFAGHDEIILLNGNAAVATVNTNIFRVNEMRAVSVGTANFAIGNITLRVASAGATINYITAGFNIARNNIFTVPAGLTLYITEWFVGWASIGDGVVRAARILIQANYEHLHDFYLYNVFHTHMEAIITSAQVVKSFSSPVSFPSGIDIIGRGVAFTGGSGPCSSILRGWLEEA